MIDWKRLWIKIMYSYGKCIRTNELYSKSFNGFAKSPREQIKSQSTFTRPSAHGNP